MKVITCTPVRKIQNRLNFSDEPKISRLSEWRGFQEPKFTCSTLLLLHTARYCYYMQLVTPSDAATAVTIDNKI